ncbi:MAG: imidazole glycerol phosphate synthase subunit HisH [Deltaproteobacteria bacterium]|nr:imidazole glycerol phosphate synthase subunit HisH [Deltaproteobacteria bacterium]
MGVIDWGGGNLGSVVRALRRAGADPVLAAEPRGLAGCARLVFPGVGAFGDVLDGFRGRGFEAPWREFVESGRQALCICVGLQALFEGSDETPGVPGLGLLRGRVRRFASGKVPQIGWNRVEPAGGGAGGVVEDAYCYFVNSYYAAPEDVSVVAGWTDYGVRFASAVAWGSITATQFHPEKSGEAGLGLLRRWLEK